MSSEIELKPCPFCGCAPVIKQWFERGEHIGFDRDRCEIECPMCCDVVHETLIDASSFWNTRPAKAVQGDKAQALEILEDIFFQNHGNKPYWDEEAKAQYETLHNALTPESEGIAGKGEKPDRECIMFLLSLGFTHKIENGFHVVEGHGFKYSHIGILNIAHRIKQAFFDTLTRPQEIDVESLVNEVTDKICANPEHSKTGMRLVVSGIVQSAIDHLHSSGRLK